MPLTMCDLIRARPHGLLIFSVDHEKPRHPADQGSEQPPADMNAILRAARHRRSSDTAPTEESEE